MGESCAVFIGLKLRAQVRVTRAHADSRCIGENLDEPAAPTKGFERSKSAWRDDEETVRVGLAGCAWDQPCASWSSLSCSAQVKCGAQPGAKFLAGISKKEHTVTFGGRGRQTEFVGTRKRPPLCTCMCPSSPYPFFEATPPSAAPGPPVKTGGRSRRFRGCNETAPFH